MDEFDPFDAVGPRIAAAQAGDAEAARELIGEFCATVLQNRKGGEVGAPTLIRPVNGGPYEHTAFDERLLDYFVGCFQQIGKFEGVDHRLITANEALNLARGGAGRGRRASKETRQEYLDCGLRVHDLLRCNPKMTVAEATERIAKGSAVGIEKVKKGHKMWRALLRSHRSKPVGNR